MVIYISLNHVEQHFSVKVVYRADVYRLLIYFNSGVMSSWHSWMNYNCIYLLNLLFLKNSVHDSIPDVHRISSYSSTDLAREDDSIAVSFSATDSVTWQQLNQTYTSVTRALSDKNLQNPKVVLLVPFSAVTMAIAAAVLKLGRVLFITESLNNQCKS